MYLQRNPWIVPVALVAVAVALYFAFISSRSSIDQPELATNWILYAVIFVVFAAIATVAYRTMRRTSRTDMDEARPKGH
jgi:high-affinity Fe2+/Pb2+ permease